METQTETDHAENSVENPIEHPVEFHGTAKEYFGIWIVNVLLSIVTLGIYGAWAKVRDKKYFYGNTFIDGQNFDYHASGKQIFIGRLIVFGALLALSASQFVSIALYGVLFLVLIILLPWIICRALLFNARVTSYRNVRFDFDGKYGGAFVSYFLLPFVSAFTAYFLSPVVTQNQQEFTIRNHKYGNRAFDFRSDVGPYFKAYFIAFGMGFVLLILVSFLTFGALAGGNALSQLANLDTSNPEAMARYYIAFFAIYIAFFIGIVPAFLFYRARIRNLAYNNTTLDERHRFRSEVRARDYIGIALSNAVIVLLTIGFMMPWARVRMARYLASKTTLIAGGPLDVYSGEVGDDVGVASSEYFDMEGFDIGIGF